MSIVLITAAFAFVLAFLLGTALGFFKEFFAVQQDPLAENILEALPGANCGACGFAGCENYATEIAAGNAGISSCSVGGAAVAEKLAGITGQAAGTVVRTVAVLACQGSRLHAPQKGTYTGIHNCRGAKLATGGVKLCSWGCLGFGDCVKACKFGALGMDLATGLPVTDYAKCTGCRMCESECPQGLLKGVPLGQKGAMPLCSNRSPEKRLAAKSCKTACIKCGLCARNCPQQCIDLSAIIPVVDLSRCDSCGTCAEKCPTKVFKLIERDIVNREFLA